MIDRFVVVLWLILPAVVLSYSTATFGNGFRESTSFFYGRKSYALSPLKSLSSLSTTSTLERKRSNRRQFHSQYASSSSSSLKLYSSVNPLISTETSPLHVPLQLKLHNLYISPITQKTQILLTLTCYFLHLWLTTKVVTLPFSNVSSLSQIDISFEYILGSIVAFLYFYVWCFLRKVVTTTTTANTNNDDDEIIHNLLHPSPGQSQNP